MPVARACPRRRDATLNANYLAAAEKAGSRSPTRARASHEFIITCRPEKATASPRGLQQACRPASTPPPTLPLPCRMPVIGRPNRDQERGRVHPGYDGLCRIARCAGAVRARPHHAVLAWTVKAVRELDIAFSRPLRGRAYATSARPPAIAKALLVVQGCARLVPSRVRREVCLAVVWCAGCFLGGNGVSARVVGSVLLVLAVGCSTRRSMRDRPLRNDANAITGRAKGMGSRSLRVMLTWSWSGPRRRSPLS